MISRRKQRGREGMRNKEVDSKPHTKGNTPATDEGNSCTHTHTHISLSSVKGKF